MSEDISVGSSGSSDASDFANDDNISDDEMESEQNEEEESEGELSGSDEEREVKGLSAVDEFIEYAMGFRGDVTIEGFQQRTSVIPADTVQETLLEYDILHHYIGCSAPCHPGGGRRQEDYPADEIDFEMVQYLLELSPDAVNKAAECEAYFQAHPCGNGAYPIHLACFNADCPVSIIKLLLEKNPSAAKVSWPSYGLPLACYLNRACIHLATGYHDDEGWNEDFPAFPSGELDYEIVKMLVEAYPEALTHSVHKTGIPLRILCEGDAVSLELAQLLIDKDHACLDIVDSDDIIRSRRESPVWALLGNSLVKPFPTDVFRYLLECNPMASTILGTVPGSSKSSSWDKFFEGETALNVACKNATTTAEIVELIIELCPKLVQTYNKQDGCLPIHILCKNEDMGEQSAIGILKLLLGAYPESVKKPAAGGATPLIAFGTEGKLPIQLADESNMSLGFCKVLLSERARQSSMPGVNILQIACFHKCSLDMVKKLVDDNHSLLLQRDGEGHVALHAAVKFASLEVVKYLVDENESTLTMQDESMELSLHKACREGKLEVVKHLVGKNESTLTVPNIMGHIALHTAAKCGSLEIVKYLVEKNISTLTITDGHGHIALHTAAKHASLEIVKFLVGKNQSTLTVSDELMELPLHKACRFGKLEVVEYLMRKNMTSVTAKNLHDQLPIHILCNKSGKTRRRLQSVKYVETIFKLLAVYPEVVNFGH